MRVQMKCSVVLGIVPAILFVVAACGGEEEQGVSAHAAVAGGHTTQAIQRVDDLFLPSNSSHPRPVAPGISVDGSVVVAGDRVTNLALGSNPVAFAAGLFTHHRSFVSAAGATIVFTGIYRNRSSRSYHYTPSSGRIALLDDNVPRSAGWLFSASEALSLSADGNVVLLSVTERRPIGRNWHWRSRFYLKDLTTQNFTRVAAKAGDTASGNQLFAGANALSADGRVVVYCLPDNKGSYDVRIEKHGPMSMTATPSTASGLSSRSEDALGVNGQEVSVSANGRWVVFTARYGVQRPWQAGRIYLHDRTTNETLAGPLGYRPSISDDGRYLAYHAIVVDVRPGEIHPGSDVHIYDRLSGRSGRVSVAADRRGGNGPSTQAQITGDGRLIAFNSYATNLLLEGNRPGVFVAANPLLSESACPPPTGWQNPRLAADVNGDGVVSPIDVLLIMNTVNSGRSPTLCGPRSPQDLYLDVNGDGVFSPADVLAVINHLNGRR